MADAVIFLMASTSSSDAYIDHAPLTCRKLITLQSEALSLDFNNESLLESNTLAFWLVGALSEN